MRFLFLVSVYAGLGVVWAVLFSALLAAEGGFVTYLIAGVAVFALTGAGLYVWERSSGHVGMLGLMPIVKKFGLWKEA